MEMRKKIIDWVLKEGSWKEWGSAALAASLFLLPFSFALFKLTLLISVFFLVMGTWQRGCWQAEVSGFDLLVLGFFVWSAVGVGLSDVSSSELWIQTVFFPILYYFLFSRQNMGEGQRKKFLQMFWLGAAFVGVLCFWELYSGAAAVQEEWVDTERFPILHFRMSGPLENPNLLAGYFSIVIAFWCGYRVFRARSRDSIAGAAGLVLFGICLLLTYSRGAWLSIFTILVGLGIWSKKRKYLFGGLFLLLLLVFLGEASILERIQSVFQPLAESSSAMRLAIWHSTLYMIWDHPVFGIGWGAFPAVYPIYDYFMGEGQIVLYHAHNLYLQIAAETGLVGFLLWISVVGAVLIQLLARIRKKDSLATGVACAIVVILLGGLTDDWLFNPKIACLFWFLIGIGQAKMKKNPAKRRIFN